MNFLIILVILLSVVLILPGAFAQNQLESNHYVYILVQTFVRDSDGNLIHYSENDRFTDKNFEMLNKFLDLVVSPFSDPIYDVNGKKFQLIQRSKTQQIDSHQWASSTILAGSEQPNVNILVRFGHDGYFLAPGDELKLVWTFMRTIN